MQYTLLSHWLNFGPSEACIETPHMRGYLNSTMNILCSDVDKCQTFVQGPVFCPDPENPHAQIYDLVGLATGSNNWCNVGAFTRLAKYVDWIKNSINYLELRYQLRREQHADDTTTKGKTVGCFDFHRFGNCVFRLKFCV